MASRVTAGTRASATFKAGHELMRDFARISGRRGSAAIALMAAAAVTEGVGLALLAPLLAVLTGESSGLLHRAVTEGFAVMGVENPSARLFVLIGAFAALVSVRAVIVAMRDRLLYDLQTEFTDARKVALMRSLGSSQWRDIASLRHARITQALSGEIPRVAMAVHALLTIALSLAMLFAQGMLVLLLSPGLAVVAVLVMAAAALISVPLTRRAYALGEAGTKRSLQLADIAGQLLGGLKLAIAQNLATAFVDEYEDTQRRFTRENREFDILIARAQVVGSVTSAVALGCLVLVGHVWSLPTATLLAALAVLSRMIGPATGVLRDLRLLAQSLPSYDALRKLDAELAGSVPRAAVATPVDFGNRTVVFDRVAFTHPGGSGLREVSASIPHGTVLGVVGPSGAGKTTFADVLCGLLAPTRGNVTIGGAPLERPGVLAAWRERIAYVAQDSYLFHDTIRRNLCWGRNETDDAELWAALALVKADALVGSIEGGLDAVVAERGTRFSGGERQRLALARALLRRPDLLILDEATNALELAMEWDILHALTTAPGRPTIVLITHRAEPLALCSQILTLDAPSPVGP